MSSVDFNTDFKVEYGCPVRLSGLVRRVTANNPSPFTFRGTNSYLVGEKAVAIIDPGPQDDAHIHALLEAVGDAQVSHIFVTHTHCDHSPAAKIIQEKTGAKIYAEGVHRPSRPLELGEVNIMDSAGDGDFIPDTTLKHGEVIEGDGWSLEAVFTPGHTANHMSFALTQENTLFSGDHVMGWSTSIVAPPDGAMTDYMASLDVVINRQDDCYYPGHGDIIEQPLRFVKMLKTHRKQRETAILEQVKNGVGYIENIVTNIYKGLDPQLKGAAGLSVYAHLEDLVATGKVICDENFPSLTSRYFITD